MLHEPVRFKLLRPLCVNMHFWICCLYRWNGKFEHFCLLQPTIKQRQRMQDSTSTTASKPRALGPHLWCRNPLCYCPPSDSGWQPPCAPNAWQISSLFCRCGAPEVLVWGLFASLWIFLVLHNWQSCVTIPGHDLWNANLASHQRGRAQPSLAILLQIIIKNHSNNYN